MARTRGKAKRRERPLGAAIGWGLAVTLGVGLLLFFTLMLIPGSALHNFFDLARNAQSTTLPLSRLYQDWAEKIQQEEALLVSPLSLLCGGVTLGRLAPRYAARKRVLFAGAAMAFGVLAVSLAFTWSEAVYSSNALATHEGGTITHLTAPAGYWLRQTLWSLAWIAVSVLGTWLGLCLRDRHFLETAGQDSTSVLRPAVR